MIAQGLPLPPDAPNAPISNLQSPISNLSPLILTAPTSNTAYQIHPGVPRASQRIAVAGYSGDGTRWATLRLVKDGVVLAGMTDTARLNTWWMLEEGRHHFWLEGQRTGNDAVERSSMALVVVEPFGATQAVGQ
jgi:hypothetical protein